MAATRKTKPSPPASLVGAWIIVGYVLAAVGYLFHLPGILALWLCILIGAWCEPAPVLTGPKKDGFATAINKTEERKLRRYQRWSGRKLALLGLSPRALRRDLNPDWPMRASFVMSLLVALIVANLDLSTWTRWLSFSPLLLALTPLLSAVIAFGLINLIAGSRREDAGYECPGTRMDALKILFVNAPSSVWTNYTLALLGLGLGGLLGLIAADRLFDSAVLGVTSCALLGLALAITRPMRTASLAHWRMVEARRADWGPKWAMLKLTDTAPFLLDSVEHGPAMVDTFRAYASIASTGMLAMTPKIGPIVGAGMEAYLLTCPDTVNDQPTPGTMHPLDFRVVTIPSGSLPDLTDPGLDIEDVRFFADLRMHQIRGPATPFALTDIEAMHCPDSPVAAYRSLWSAPAGGINLPELRQDLGTVSATLGCEAAIDHRNPAGLGTLFFGGLTDEGVLYPDDTRPAPPPVEAVEDESGEDEGGDPPRATIPPDLSVSPPAAAEPEGSTELVRGETYDTMEFLQIEDYFNGVWSSVMKNDANPPTPQKNYRDEGEIYFGRTSVRVERQAFQARNGQDVREFFTFDDRLATAMGACPFVATMGWVVAQSSRRAQAFALVWARQLMPDSLDQLTPPPGSGRVFATGPESAYQWYLSGRINHGFTAIRQTRPETYRVRCLTSPTSRGHIWQVEIKLMGGVAISEVRSLGNKLRQALGASWLRVADSNQHGHATIFVGADPSRVTLARPEQDGPLIASLEWEAAFLATKVRGSDGSLPKLRSVDTLPNNTSVQVLEFELPGGLSLSHLRDAVGKLRTATANAFVEIRTSAAGANFARVLVSKENPLPDRVDFDFEVADRLGLITFATNVEGEPVSFDPRTSPHLLCAGVTGGGKSSLAQALLWGARAQMRARLVIIDAVKGAADFAFLEDHCVAVGRDEIEGGAIMKAVYAEVVRRKNLNTKYGTDAFGLPAEVAYQPLYLFIDEFTSLMVKEALPVTSDDPEVMLERRKIEQINAAKAMIGAYTGKIAREARSADVHLILGAQKLSAKLMDSIPGGDSVKGQMARTLLGKASAGERMSALRIPDGAPAIEGDVPIGRGLWESLTNAAEVVQCWWVPQEVYARELNARIDPEQTRLDFEQYLPREDDGDDIADFSIIPDETPEILATEDGVVVTDVAMDFELDFDDLGIDTGGDPAEPDDEVNGVDEEISEAVVTQDPFALVFEDEQDEYEDIEPDLEGDGNDEEGLDDELEGDDLVDEEFTLIEEPQDNARESADSQPVEATGLSWGDQFSWDAAPAQAVISTTAALSDDEDDWGAPAVPSMSTRH